MEDGIARLKTLPLSLRLVRELHKKLMTNQGNLKVTPFTFRMTRSEASEVCRAFGFVLDSGFRVGFGVPR